MDYMLANPGVSLGEIAKAFNYTQGWLSQIIHSDAFQAMLRDKQGVIFHNTVMPIREKMLGVASLALDRMIEKVQVEGDLSTLSKTAEGVLDRLGFGSKGGNTFIMNQTNNTQVNTLRSELDEAKALLGRAERPQIGVTIDESGKQPALPAPSQTDLGQEYLAKGTPLQATGSEGTPAEEGDQA
jgi:hypothetical protein